MILESKGAKRGPDNKPIDGSILGDGDFRIAANHAYVVVDYNRSAGTIDLYNPWGIPITISGPDLRFFSAYNNFLGN